VHRWGDNSPAAKDVDHLSHGTQRLIETFQVPIIPPEICEGRSPERFREGALSTASGSNAVSDTSVAAGPREAGVTLLEVMVATAILNVVFAMFTTGIVVMYKSTRVSDSMALAQSQLHIAFQRLDREVRYASSVSAPSAVADGNGDWYVEYLSTYTGTETCTQLRLRTRSAPPLLQRRTWAAGGAPPNVWGTLASSVTASRPPFVFIAADGNGAESQQLELHIIVSAPGSTKSRTSDIAFTAVNSSIDTVEPTECTQHRPGA
jgi:Tfp pilus assembly protein PilE